MSSGCLVICDQEEEYAAALADFLARKKGLALSVQMCNDTAQVLELQKNCPIDILLISSKCPKEDRGRIRSVNTVILTDYRKEETDENESAVYKYQSGETIMRELIGKCSKMSVAESLFLETVRKKSMKTIGIFSPIHRCGKTSYALELGKRLSVSQNVLYLNLELYGGIGGHFPETGQTLADALYYSRQERKNFGAVLTGMVRHLGSLDYLLPVRISEDIKAVEPEDWICLLEQIAAYSLYDILILDIDEGIRGVYSILRLCTEIYVPEVTDEIGRAKMFQFQEELHLLGYDDISRKITVRRWEHDTGGAITCEDPAETGYDQRN